MDRIQGLSHTGGSMPSDAFREFGQFPTTHWSLVDRVGGDGDEACRAALGDLLLRYLPALRAHLVFGRRVPQHDADDLLQEFIATKILQKELLGQADRQRGRFRSFLLKSLDRLLIDQLRRHAAGKRAPDGKNLQALGDHEEWLQTEGQPSDAFELAWARSVLDQAIAQMRRHCEQFNRPDCWGLFECRVLNPILHDAAPTDYDELRRQFGFQSPAQASNVLMTAKRMFARVLRSVVGEYARDDDEIEEEMGRLRQVLSEMSSAQA